MKKIFGVVLIGLLFGGCVSTQDKIDLYKKKRDALVSKVNITSSKADCIAKCRLNCLGE